MSKWRQIYYDENIFCLDETKLNFLKMSRLDASSLCKRTHLIIITWEIISFFFKSLMLSADNMQEIILKTLSRVTSKKTLLYNSRKIFLNQSRNNWHVMKKILFDQLRNNSRSTRKLSLDQSRNNTYSIRKLFLDQGMRKLLLDQAMRKLLLDQVMRKLSLD
jgi:hypothetical protein